MKVTSCFCVFLILFATAMNVIADTCTAPYPFEYGSSGPFGYTCNGGTVVLTALNRQVVSFGNIGNVVVAQDFVFSCCNSRATCGGSASWTIPSPYKISASNYLKADGWCAQATASDGVGATINANTPQCNVDASNITTVCGSRLNCGCQYSSCGVTQLGRTMSGTITITAWGDCSTTNLYGPDNHYTPSVALVYDIGSCAAPSPFVRNGAGVYGYTCSSTADVLLTGLGNLRVVAWRGSNTVVVAKDFTFTCCNSQGTCGNTLTWTLPSAYHISSSNYLKADGWCAQATATDGGSTISAPTFQCNVNNPNVTVVCGEASICGCVYSSCAVTALGRELAGTTTITAWGDCSVTKIYGPSVAYAPTVALTYGH